MAHVLSAALDKEIEPSIVGKFREGDIRHGIADISQARNIQDYEPCVSFEQGIRELTEWGRYQKADDRVEGSARELERRELMQ